MLIMGALDDAQPNWRLAALGYTQGSLLRKALERLFGRGPGACVVFNNGDSACYKVHPESYAVTLVEGSAKNASGQLIGSAGGGGNEGLNVLNDPPYLGWQAPDDEVWLMCFYIDGVLQYCWVEP